MKRFIALYAAFAAAPFFLFSAYLITAANSGEQEAGGVICGFLGIALTILSARMIWKLSR